jgi:hypothetical protein
LFGFFGFTATSGSPYRSDGSFVTFTCVGREAETGDDADVAQLADGAKQQTAITAATTSSLRVVPPTDLSHIDRIPAER